MPFGQRLSLITIFGITAGLVSSADWAASAAVAVAAFAVALASRVGRLGRCRWCHWWIWSAVAAVAVAVGAHARDAALMTSPRWLSAADGALVVEGRLRRDASLQDSSTESGSDLERESGVRFDLDDVRVQTMDGVVQTGRLRILITVGGTLARERLPEWTAGRRVTMPARLRVPSIVRNPGSPSPRWQRLTRPFDLVGTVKSGALVNVEPAAAWQEAAAAVRRHVRAVTNNWLVPRGGYSAAVVTAILIGDRAGLDDAVTSRLQVAGTFHVIAISGGNVAMLTAVCLFLCRLVTRGDRLPLLLTLFIVIAYGLIVGRDASVTRAVVAATLYLSLRVAGIVPNPVSVVALTALVCAVADPLVVLDAGAWLSFGATLGLVTILPALLRRVGEPSRKRRSLGRMVWLVVRGLLLSTIAAEIAILPVVAAVFMRVGVAGVLLNLVAVPAMVLAQGTGLLLCTLSPVWTWWPGLGSVLALAAHTATSLLIGSAGLVEIVPVVSWRVPPPPLAVIAAYYAAVIVALARRGRPAGKRGAIVAAGVLACAIATAPWTPWRRPASGWVRITMIDVGQGEAIAVQLPSGHALLVDAGGSPGSFDVGSRLVTPALWASGIRRLDWLALTHGDVDHVGGALRVAEDLRPQEIWEGVPIPSHLPLARLRRGAHANGIAWRRLQAGQQLELGGVVIDVLHPPAPDWERPRVRNDDSIVFRLRFGRFEVMLTGDAGAEFESPFTRDPAGPPIRVLKLAHHGSRSSSAERFLDAYAPAVALVSAGQDNLFGHPSHVVLDRLAQRGIDVFRTDQDGATVIETDGREARVRSATGRTLTVTTGRVSPVATRPRALR